MLAFIFCTSGATCCCLMLVLLLYSSRTYTKNKSIFMCYHYGLHVAIHKTHTGKLTHTNKEVTNGWQLSSLSMGDFLGGRLLVYLNLLVKEHNGFCHFSNCSSDFSMQSCKLWLYKNIENLLWDQAVCLQMAVDGALTRRIIVLNV